MQFQHRTVLLLLQAARLGYETVTHLERSR